MPILTSVGKIGVHIARAWEIKAIYPLTPMYLIPRYNREINKRKNYLIARGCKID